MLYKIRFDILEKCDLDNYLLAVKLIIYYKFTNEDDDEFWQNDHYYKLLENDTWLKF